MKKIFYLIFAALLSTSIVSCQYDDDKVWDAINELKSDMDALEKILAAQQNKLTISSVTSTENGYVITFSDGTTATISNGKDGKDGDEVFKDVDVSSNCFVIFTLSDDTKVTIPRVGIKVLTFEDTDAKFSTYTINTTNSITKWSDLVDKSQYGGALLYNDFATSDYNWYDENNTLLKSALLFGGPFWNGGHAISNYSSIDIEANNTYEQQLTVYGEAGKGGHNGSANFCVHNGYGSPSSGNGTLPAIEFADNIARIIDHMYVNSTTYMYYAYVNGSAFNKAATDSDWFKIIATGYDAAGNKTGETEFYLGKGKECVQEWTKWDLSNLGKVTKVEFNVTGTDVGDWGLNTPAYFAYDDIVVCF